MEGTFRTILANPPVPYSDLIPLPHLQKVYSLDLRGQHDLQMQSNDAASNRQSTFADLLDDVSMSELGQKTLPIDWFQPIPFRLIEAIVSRHSRNRAEVNRRVGSALPVFSTVHEVVLQQLQVAVPVVLPALPYPHRELHLLRAGT